MAISHFWLVMGVFLKPGCWFLFQMASFGPLQRSGGVALSNFDLTHLSIHATYRAVRWQLKSRSSSQPWTDHLDLPMSKWLTLYIWLLHQLGVFLRAFEVKRGATLVVTICPNIWTRRLFARRSYSKLFTRLRDDLDFRNGESCKIKKTCILLEFY